jgi:ribosomal protein S18 acetylase RimI-like enzyme
MIIKICQTKTDFEKAIQLTTDYMEWLNMDLCFQNVNKEFNEFDQIYAKPNGVFLLAYVDGEIAGGVGSRKIEKKICEMKRLYVYDQFKGKGIGRKLCEALIVKSRSMGYKKMRLDTVSKLETAIKLYKKIGFYKISPYYSNPDETVIFMEYDLSI